MIRVFLSSVVGAAAVLLLAFCRPPEQPPIPPPAPTDPTISHALALYPAEEVLDASIVREAGAATDASVPELGGGIRAAR